MEVVELKSECSAVCPAVCELSVICSYIWTVSYSKSPSKIWTGGTSMRWMRLLQTVNSLLIQHGGSTMITFGGNSLVDTTYGEGSLPPKCATCSLARALPIPSGSTDT